VYLARTLSARFEICNACCGCESAYETRRYSIIAFIGIIAIFFAFGYFDPRGVVAGSAAPPVSFSAPLPSSVDQHG
jgi:hypothetical protein